MNKTQQTIGIIRPETVAHKLSAIRNYEYPKLLEQIKANPRLTEMLWFLQYMSLQPGGLVKFSEDLIEQLPQRFGTAAMRAAKQVEYSVDLKVVIWAEIPRRYLPESAPELSQHGGADNWQARDLLAEKFDYSQSTKHDQVMVEKFLKPWTKADFSKICLLAARDVLPGYLAALCNEIDKGFTRDYRSIFGNDLWFIDDPIAAVFEMMDRHASQVSKRLATTAVTKKVFDALDYALQEHAMVRVEGDSRFGKTESVRAWCDMRPGLARLVSVPSSNSLADLHGRIAEALGMDVSYGSRKQGVKERIEFVLKHSGIFIVLDEGAFLVPQNYTSDTAPARLNWVRTEIVDRGLPLAVVVTPQTFLPLVNRFVKKTGYAMEQFFGRNHRVVQLPAELDQKDMIAVARIHFPELAEDDLAYVADLATVSENYLQAVEAIAKLARYIARREKHPRITDADLEAAASEVIPRRVLDAGAETEPEAADDSSAEEEPSSGSKRVKTPLKGVARGLKPDRGAEPKQPDLKSRSGRRAGSGETETELVSTEA